MAAPEPTPTPSTPGRIDPGLELDLHPGARTYEDDDESLEPQPEPGSPLLKTWTPSQNYRYELRDITEQMTPAEAYRHRLVTAGKEKRVLQRLEWKWARNFELWDRSCTLVKAGYRGMLGRRYFAKVKEALQLQLAQRRCKEQTIDAYMNGEPQLALDTIETVPEMTRDLYIIKFKILYTTKMHAECIRTTLLYLGRSLSHCHLFSVLTIICFRLTILCLMLLLDFAVGLMCRELGCGRSRCKLHAGCIVLLSA
jgi:hypothetical protein